MMKIRKIEKADKEDIDKLYLQLYTDKTEAPDLSEEGFTCKQVSFCLEEDGKIIGYVNGVAMGFGDLKEGEMFDLYIDKDFRGKGFGRKLVEVFEKECKDFGADYIFIGRDDDGDEEDPTSFYEKLGYKVMEKPWLVKKF